MLSDKLDHKYPEPFGQEWQDKYRNAKAYESVAEDVVNFFVNLESESERLAALEKEEQTSIEEA